MFSLSYYFFLNYSSNVNVAKTSTVDVKHLFEESQPIVLYKFGTR